MSRIDEQPIRPRRKSTRKAQSLAQMFETLDSMPRCTTAQHPDDKVQQTIAILQTCDRASRLKIFDWLTDHLEQE